MKILGIYEIKIGANVMNYLVTENMLGSDKDRVYRCYDLKGSTFGRNTKLTDEEIEKGSGSKPLKDEDFMNLYHDQDSHINCIAKTKKDSLVERMKKDSELLRDHNLIDYSVLMFQIDRKKAVVQKKLNIKQQMFKKLVLDRASSKFSIVMNERTESDFDFLQTAYHKNIVDRKRTGVLPSKYRNNSLAVIEEFDDSQFDRTMSTAEVPAR